MLDDPRLLAGTWWRRRAIIAMRLGGEVNVQMQRATVPVRVCCTVRGVDSVDCLVLTSFKIDIGAHIFARFVLCLAPLVDACLAILLALGFQLLGSWARHEHIDIALNLLGGRPIDLSVLLGTLHPVHFSIKFDAASLAACHLIHIAGCPHSLSVSTGARLEVALGLVTFFVSCLMRDDGF